MPVTANISYQYFPGKPGSPLPPVVLIHGAGGSHLSWPPQIRRLGVTGVYALDLPGHGRSGGAICASIPSYARAVMDWADALHLVKTAFAGHSMGSAIAMQIALTQPERVAGLALLGSGARLKVAPILLEKVSDLAAYPEVIELVTRWSFGPHTPARLKELAALRMAETPAPVLHADFTACNAFDITDQLDQIGQPSLILTGEEDRMTPATLARALAENLPRARLQLIPQAGHMLMLEKPLEVAAVLIHFLEHELS